MSSKPLGPTPLAADLNLLTVFAVVAAERSLTRAAARLGVSQPAVSERMRRLERLVRSPVFERAGRGIRLTAAGEALRPLAAATLAAAHEGAALFAGLAGHGRGVVRGAASTTVAGYVLPEAIASLRRRRPLVEIDVRVGNTAQVAAAVERGDVPWGFVEGPVDPARFAARTVRHDELILVVPAGHRWAVRRSVAPAALLEEPFIARERGSGTGAIYERALAAHGVRLRASVRLAHSRGIVAAVAAGVGVGIVSALVAAPFLEEGRVVRLALRGVDLARALRLIQLPGRTLGPLDAELLRDAGASGVR